MTVCWLLHMGSVISRYDQNWCSQYRFHKPNCPFSSFCMVVGSIPIDDESFFAEKVHNCLAIPLFVLCLSVIHYKASVKKRENNRSWINCDSFYSIHTWYESKWTYLCFHHNIVVQLLVVASLKITYQLRFQRRKIVSSSRCQNHELLLLFRQ